MGLSNPSKICHWTKFLGKRVKNQGSDEPSFYAGVKKINDIIKLTDKIT